MALDFTQFFEKYQAIIAEADAVFQKIRGDYAKNVRCEKGCSDCCHALFDLTLVEALYLNAEFLKHFSGLAKTKVLELADEADRAIHKLKRDAYKAAKDGKNASDILLEMAKVRVRCPLLDDEGLCSMYDHRPVTCRIYGVPTAIGGQAHTCGKSAFEPGKPYPTVYLDRIQDRLYALSHELAATLNSRYKGLGEVLVPPSMALMTDYTEEYLGVVQEKKADAKKPAAAKPAAAAKRPAARAQGLPGKPAQGKGAAECAGCSPESKQGGCAGCNPTSFTIGQAPAKPAKKASAEKAAPKKAAPKAGEPKKPAAKKSAKAKG